MNIALEALALCALLGMAGVAGWAWRGEQDQDKLLAATASVTACGSAADAKAAALATTQTALTDLRQRHTTALAAAAAALADRNAQIEVLQTAATDRATHIAQSPHEDKNCQALADLPICAAVARELWPAAAQTRASDHPPGGD